MTLTLKRIDGVSHRCWLPEHHAGELPAVVRLRDRLYTNTRISAGAAVYEEFIPTDVVEDVG